VRTGISDRNGIRIYNDDATGKLDNRNDTRGRYAIWIADRDGSGWAYVRE
jgi:hypothetical protein